VRSKFTGMKSDELIKWSAKTIEWLSRLSRQADETERQNRGRFDGLADAAKADAANYRAVIRDGQRAIAAATKETQ
jgi:hypothetical protein